MVDLHIHTTASDGQYSPAQIVLMAKNAGLTMIAITDHDTIAGIEEGREAVRGSGIKFIGGIEISVQCNRELHILGYKVDPKNPALLSLCEGFAEGRRERGPRISEYLRGYGIHIDLEQAQKHTGGELLGRPHFARALVDAGYVETIREAFDRYLGIPAFDKVERPKPPPGEGIKVITGAGGLAVLAHPKQLKLSDADLEKLLCELIQHGLGGIECYYSTHTPRQTEFYLYLAQKYGLAVTGGSDFHGENVKPEILPGTGINGSLNINENDVSNIFHR
jgi:predicted metal-dependent phosphoesterase TrpH